MHAAEMIDTALDRSVALGYANIGLEVRKRLPGWPAEPPRMDGKVVLVTGAGSGIGLAAAAGFARLGASVRALGRDEDRAAQAAAMARTQAGTPDADVRPVACDVSRLDALRAFIEQFGAQEQRLDVLVNNAGVMPDERTRTADGIEAMFATHVLAPWVLTDGLLPLLKAAAPSRVINVTSGGQYGQQVPDGDLQSEHTRYGPKKVYARTKREQVVITREWARRLAGDAVYVHAMHPGWADTKGVQQWMPTFRAVTRPFIRTPEQGADTVVWLGSAPGAIQSTGQLWQDRRPRPLTYRFGAGPDDDATAGRLWDYVADLGMHRPAAGKAAEYGREEQ
jgi:NAD(P)-dependent dehydrogenase (short-subunit alcohol dehydrogenase family)